MYDAYGWRENHRKSALLSSDAMLLEMSGGDANAIRETYAKAAIAEGYALESINKQDLPTTYWATALSVASLFFKAGQLEVASRLCHGFASDGDIPLPEVRRFIELQELVQQQRTIQS